MRTNFWKNLLLVCAGVVVGSLVASVTRGISYLSWLSYGLTFGTQQPFTLDMGVLRLTFGLNVDITLATIIFVTLVYVIGRKILR